MHVTNFGHAKNRNPYSSARIRKTPGIFVRTKIYNYNIGFNLVNMFVKRIVKDLVFYKKKKNEEGFDIWIEN